MPISLLAIVLLVSLAACAGQSSSPPPLVHRFDHAERWSKEFDDPSRDEWQKPAAVVAAMKIEPGMTVADIGAGTGYFEPYLSRAVGANGKVLALDIEPDMVRHLRERAAREHLDNVQAEVVATDDPKLPAGKLDRILVVDTWHHIPAREAYAAKLAGALAPGGTVTIVDFKKDAHHGPPPHHRLAPETIIAELEKGGLSASVASVDLPEQYVVVGAKK